MEKEVKEQKNSWLYTTPIAHRGLWNNEITENSISAYKNAIEKGYPIEIDLYMTTDNEIVCFHDKTLDRMTNGKGFIFEKSLKELKELNLLNSNEKIPTLKEVLTLCEGKTPLLIEYKDQPNKNFVKVATEILKNYKGEFAVQCFNPLMLNKIRKTAPEFTRGLLASDTPDTKNPLEKFVVKYMPFNFLCRPQFISYEYTGLPLKRKAKNKHIIAWTLTNQADADKIKNYTENIIFEKFIPIK